MLIAKSKARQYIQDRAPGTRVSAEYYNMLDNAVRSLIRQHLKANGHRKTLRADSVTYKEKWNGIARADRKRVR